MSVCAYTAVCEEDSCWIPQYLSEVERLKLPFVMHADRCSRATIELFFRHPYCLDVTYQNNPRIEFEERHKQRPFDVILRNGYNWAMAWDIDETYEKGAPAKLLGIQTLDADYVDVNWVNLWNDPEHIRVDGTFGEGHRVKFYNLKTMLWKFDHAITNGAKPVASWNGPIYGAPEAKLVRYDLVCLHWGMMTPELRRLHKERWDRIYSTALKGDPNPYGFWRHAIETEEQAVIVPHNYL